MSTYEFLITILIGAILLLIGSICCGILISANRKKYIWILPTIIGAVASVYSGRLHGEEQMFNIYFYPIILSCIVFMLIYYLKVLNISTKLFSTKKKITMWTVVIAVLITTATIATLIITKPMREQAADQNKMNMTRYQSSALVSHTLSDYTFPKVVIKQNPNRDVEFNSFKISLPYDIDSETISKEDEYLIVSGKDSSNTDTGGSSVASPDPSQGLDPELIFFDSKWISVSSLPGIKDKSMESLLKKSINLQMTYSDYSQVVKALNTVPQLESDGTVSNSEMNSPEIQFKKDLDIEYANDLKIQRIVFSNPAINGLLYETSKMQIAEIYINNLLEYAFIVHQEQDNKSIDYILSSIDAGNAK